MADEYVPLLERLGFTKDAPAESSDFLSTDSPYAAVAPADNQSGDSLSYFDRTPLAPEPVPSENPAFSTSPLRRNRSRAGLELEQRAADGFDVSSPNQPGDESLNVVDRFGLGLDQGGAAMQGQAGGLLQAAAPVFNSIYGPLAGPLVQNEAAQAGIRLSRAARAKQQELSDLGDVSGPSSAGDMAQGTGSFVAGMAPIIPASIVGGVPGAAAVIATQTAGDVMDNARQGFEDQGYGQDDALKMARPVAAITGAVTGGLTFAGGLGRMIEKLKGGQLAQGAFSKIVTDVTLEALKGFPAMFSQTMAPAIAEKLTYNPDISMTDAVSEALVSTAQMMGFSLGTGLAGVGVGHALGGRSDVAPGQAQLDALVQESQPQATEPRRPKTFDDVLRSINYELLVRDPRADLQNFRDVLNSIGYERKAPVAPEIPSTPAVAPERGFVAPQAEMPFADQSFALAQETAPDNARIVQERAQAEADRAASEANQLPLQERPVEPPSNSSETPNSSQPVGLSRARRNQKAAAPVEANAVAAEGYPPDAMTDLENRGVKIKRFKPGMKSAFADEWQAAQEANPEAFAKNGGETPENAHPDQAAGTAAIADWLRSVGDAGKQRAAFDERVKAEQQRIDFENVVVKGNRTKGKTDVIDKPVDTMAVGDEFKVEGRPKTLVVDRVETDPNDETILKGVWIDGGDKFGKQFVPAGAVLKIDKYSFKPADGRTAKQIDSFGDAALAPRAPFQEPQQPTIVGRTPSGSLIIDNSQIPADAARGIPAIRARIEQSSMPKTHKDVALNMLDNPVFKDARWDTLGLRFEEGRTRGSFDVEGSAAKYPNGWLVTLSEKKGGPEIAPHELFHVIWDMLTPEDQQAIEQARLKAMPKDAPQSIRDGLSTEDFASANLPHELYQYRSGSEFMAKLFGDKTARELMPRTTWQKIVDYFNAFVDSIKKEFGGGESLEQMRKRILKGEFEQRPVEDTPQNRAIEGSLSRNAKEPAEHARMAESKGDEEKRIEGYSQLAQGVDIGRMYDAAGVANLPKSIQNIIRAPLISEATRAGTELNGGKAMTYNEIMASPDVSPTFKKQFAHEAGVQVSTTKLSLNKAVRNGVVAEDRMQSRAWRKLEDKVAQAENRKGFLESNLRERTAMLRSAADTVGNFLKSEGKSDVEIARAQGELNGIEEASQSGIAMDRLQEDTVQTLLRTPEGQAALENGSPREIQSTYLRFKKEFGEELPARSEPLLRWSSYLISKGTEARNRMIALELAKNPAVVAGMSDFTRQVLEGMNTNPGAMTSRLVRDLTKSAKELGDAEWTWLQLRKPFLREAAKLQRTIDGGNFAKGILASPEWISHESRVMNDIGYGGPNRVKILSPNGMFFNSPVGSVDFTLRKINGPDFDAKLAELRDWIKRTEDFIAANPDHHEGNYIRAQLAIGEGTWVSHNVINPNQRQMVPFLGRTLGIVQKLSDNISGRAASIVRLLAQRWDTGHEFARVWTGDTSAKVGASFRAAMLSHDMKWDFQNGFPDAVKHYYDTVFREIAAKAQEQSNGLNVGDVLDSGEIVTREDIRLLRLQAEKAKKAADFARDRGMLVEDTIKKGGVVRGGGQALLRQSIQTRENMLPRQFEYDLLDQYRGDESGKMKFSEHYRNALKTGDWSKVESILDGIFAEHGKAFVSNRGSNAKPTVFDDGGQFDLVRQKMISEPDSITNMAELGKALSDVSDRTPEEAKQIVLQEFGRQFAAWMNAVGATVKSFEAIKKAGFDPKNAFTLGRLDGALAPHTFYRTGFAGDGDILRHGAAIHNVDRAGLSEGLTAVLEDMKVNRGSMLQKIQNEKVAGKRAGAASRLVMSWNEIDKMNGDTFDNFVRIDSKIAQIESILNDLNSPRYEDDLHVIADRLFGNSSAFLVKNSITAIRNIVPTNLGWAIKRTGRQGSIVSQLMAAGIGYSTAVEVGAKSVGNGIYGIVRALGTLPKAWEKSPEGNAMTRSFGGMLKDWVNLWERDMHFKVDATAQAIADKILYAPENPGEKVENIWLSSLVTGGRIPAKDLNTFHKLSGAVIGIPEATLLPALAMFPTMGDLAQNASVIRATKNKVVGVNSWVVPLNAIFNRIEKGERRYNFDDPYDRVNQTIGKDLAVDHNQLVEVKVNHEESGLDFDKMVYDYLKSRKAGNKMVDFASPEQINKIIRTNLYGANISSPSRTFLPLQNTSKPLVKLAGMLQGWNSRSFGTWTRFLAVPFMNGEKARNIGDVRWNRMRQWSIVGASMIAMMGTAALTGGQVMEEVVRFLKKFLFNQDTSRRRFWEEETTAGKIASYGRQMLETIPYIGPIANWINPANAPARASLNPSFVALNIFKAVGDYFDATIKTHDPTFALPQLIEQVIPDTKILFNRMDSLSGSREANNLVALAKRFGPEDLVRKPGGGVDANYSELSPYTRLLQNYAMNGDKEKLQSTFNEAVEVARKLGKANPEQFVAQMYASKNPITTAFSNKLTPEQHAQMLSQMNDSQRADFTKGEMALQQGAQWLGINIPTFVKRPEPLVQRPPQSPFTQASRQVLATDSNGVMAPTRSNGGISGSGGGTGARASASSPFGAAAPMRSASPLSRLSVQRGVSGLRRAGGSAVRRGTSALRRSVARGPRRSLSRASALRR